MNARTKLAQRKLGLGPVAALLAIGLVACEDDPNQLLGGRRNASTDGTDTSAALECTAKPEGRSYVLFDGSKLEGTRINEAGGVNRARIKPHAVMATEYERVLGVVPASVRASASSFGSVPERWYAEPVHSGVSMSAVFDISFEGCLSYVKTAGLSAAPAADSASTECTKLMRKAWNRSPSPEEISECTDLAVTKLAGETDVARRWAYVCASILSSSQFLTF